MVFQIQEQSLRPQTTAHLAQTMTLLGLTIEELQQRIERELASNPALELIEERRCPTCDRLLTAGPSCPVCTAPHNATGVEPVVFVSTREDLHIGGERLDGELPEDNLAPVIENLANYVLRQIAPDLSPEDRPLAAHILTSLNDDGLLAVPVAEIAQYHFVPISRVQDVIRTINRAKPLGVGSPTSQEALLAQLEVLSENEPVPPLTDRAIREGMMLMSHHQYGELGRLLGISTRDAHRIAEFISDNLYPFPARAHWGDIRQQSEPSTSVFHNPDIVISLLTSDPDSPLLVEILMPIAGTLQVNPQFRNAIHRAPADKTEDWKEHLENASLLVKCLRQRNHTMVRLMQSLVVLQRSFILHGDAHLQPVTRAHLAKELEVHESTVSRAVANKSVLLPNGRMIPLAQFFDRSLHIRTALKQIISQETKPLSDAQIKSKLAQQGFQIARRTVAKYRSMEGILPAHLRQAPSTARSA